MKTMALHEGDITKLAVDAIVNAANSSLLGGGGVDGAIHRAAGPELLAYCRTLNGCPTGEAKISPGFKLPARYIIHTVGPVWRGGDQHEEALLASCYQNVLQLAEQNALATIAFPAISCGAYGFPIALAAQIAVENVARFMRSATHVSEIVFVSFDPAVTQAVQAHLKDADI